MEVSISGLTVNTISIGLDLLFSILFSSLPKCRNTHKLPQSYYASLDRSVLFVVTCCRTLCPEQWHRNRGCNCFTVTLLLRNNIEKSIPMKTFSETFVLASAKIPSRKSVEFLLKNADMLSHFIFSDL